MKRFAIILLAALAGCASAPSAAPPPLPPTLAATEPITYPPPGVSDDGLVGLPHRVGAINPIELTLHRFNGNFEFTQTCVTEELYRGVEITTILANPGADPISSSAGALQPEGDTSRKPIPCAPGASAGGATVSDMLRGGGALTVTLSVRLGNGALEQLTRTYVQDERGRLWLKP